MTTSEDLGAIATAGGEVDEDRWDELVTRARKDVEEGPLPSCQLAVARHGEVVFEATIGDPGTDGPADQARYVIFSCTKAITAGAVWLLLGSGDLSIDTKVADVIPEFASNGKDGVTVEQLMTHTSGFPMAPLGPPQWLEREGRLAAYEKWRLNWEPGSQFEYHPSAAHWVLADLVEQVSGMDYRVFYRTRMLDPLGLDRLQVGVPLDQQADVAPMAGVGDLPTAEEIAAVPMLAGLDLGGGLTGDVAERALLSIGRPENLALGVPGGGGVASAGDLALYYQALLHNPGGLWDAGVLADGTGHVRCTLPDPMMGVPSLRTLGLAVAGDDGQSGFRQNFGRTVSARAFGHAGAAGQIAWADPATGLSFAYCTNGLDRNLLREARRGMALSSRAAVLTQPPT